MRARFGRIARAWWPGALVLLAQIAVELDRYEEAIRHLESALEIEPSARVRRYLEQVEEIRDQISTGREGSSARLDP